MTAPATVIPPPLDDDVDDVVWALQTAAVQWRRGAKADAVVWLRRAVDAAIQSGSAQRAMELNAMIASVEEKLVASVFDAVPDETTTTTSAPDVDALLAPPAPGSTDVDSLLSSPARKAGVSIDIEFEEVEMVDRTDVMPPRQPMESVPPDSTTESLAKVRSGPPPPPSGRPNAAPDLDEPTFDGSSPLPRFPSTPDSDLDAPTQTHSISITGEVDRPTMAEEPRFTDPSPPPVMEEPPPPPDPSAPPPPPSAPPANDDDAGARVGAIDLADVPGLQDLPPEAQQEFAGKARLEKLDVDEEVGSFAVALVLEGWASIMPTIADVTCAFAQAGDVVFTHGTLEEGVALRVVAGETDTIVAVWDKDALADATAGCPWVADELRVVADRFQALAGAGMGPLGDRLDDSLRQSVTDRCRVRRLLPGELIVEKNHELPGMFIVGGGTLEIVGDSGQIEQELGPGDFLFPASVMSAAPAPSLARAAESGALVLFTERIVAMELIVTVSPLLEILAS